MSSRLTVAILSQTSNKIGLFEILRIQQSSIKITWIKPKHSPLEEWVRPRAILSYDPLDRSVQTEDILLLRDAYLRFDNYGKLFTENLVGSTLTRMPYSVSFWEDTDRFPVYLLYPDQLLPWENTIVSRVRQNNIQSLPVRRNSFAEEHVPVRRVSRILSSTAVCPITLESITMQNAYWTPCGHAFSAALERALNNDTRCPICRTYCIFRNCNHA